MSDDPLTVAERHLSALAAQADEAGEFPACRLLETLAGVVDHVRRLSLPHLGDYYRCEKAGVLVQNALTAQRLVFEALAGWPEEASYEADRLDEAVEVLTDLVPVVRSVLWATAEGRLVTRSVARQAAEAAGSAQAWATGIAATAVPDDDGAVW